MADEDLTIRRIHAVDLYRDRRDDAVWRCCRSCNAEIPPSAPEMAYCDEECKRESMAREMGFPPGG